ncbi:sensor histidine kinase [Streptococcus hongkongensis]|nr:hypothetical protein NC01_09170 [Streptococcus uberis]
MLSLKQYGDLGLNWLKHLKNKPKRHLRGTLFLQPLGIVLSSFILLFLVFNLCVYLFIHQETIKAVDAKSRELQGLYLSQPRNNHAKSIFETSYMIIDDKENIQYSSMPLHDFSHRFDTDNLLEYFFDKEHSKKPFKNQDTAKLTLKNNSYAIKLIPIRGTLKDYYVQQSENPSQDKSYFILIFVNTTPLQQFLILVNSILAIIMILTFIATGMMMFWTTRKLNLSFKQLQAYVLRAGSRKTNSDRLNLPYEEFNQVVRSVDHMNEMIESNQRSQELFFQNSSHELRTPLMSIQSYAEAIHKNLVNQEDASLVILEESQKMAKLVDDILTISRIELIPDKLNRELINLADLIYDVSWRLNKQAEQSGITIRHHFENKNMQLFADEELLERALSNILSNAVRFARHQITITCNQVADTIQIRLANDGQTISPDEKEHLFERFYKGKNGNHGIGLAMTKDIISYHGGQITVQSNETETAFIISLPIQAT